MKKTIFATALVALGLSMVTSQAIAGDNGVTAGIQNGVQAQTKMNKEKREYALKQKEKTDKARKEKAKTIPLSDAEVKKKNFTDISQAGDASEKQAMAKRENERLKALQSQKESKKAVEEISTKPMTLKEREEKKENFSKISAERDSKVKQAMAKKENERLKTFQKKKTTPSK